MRRWLRRRLLGDDYPEWVPVGVEDPAAVVELTLEGLGPPLDLSRNNVLVDIVPFVLAVALPAASAGSGAADVPSPGRRAAVVAREPDTRRELGSIDLAVREVLHLPECVLVLFGTTGSRSLLAAPWRMRLNRLHQRLRLLMDHDPRNVDKMPAGELFAVWMLYTAPRPVVLVSYGDSEAANFLTADMLGPTASPYFLLGLRTGTPALARIAALRRLAVSTLPPSYRSIAFRMGGNQRHETVDLAGLPFPVALSAGGIPVPEAAPSVREVTLERLHPVGHHSVLVTVPDGPERGGPGLRLCHTHRLYQQYRARRGRALPRVQAPRSNAG